MQILEYPFFQNALIGSLLASTLCGFIGTYIVTKRLAFISGGITHASLGGIGIGVYMGINPMLSAIIFSIMSALGIQWMSRRGKVREDSAIAIFWTFGMSIGILFCFLTPGFMPDLPSYLFGSILTIDHANIWLLLTLCLISAVVFKLFGTTIIAVAFDPVFAKSQRLPVGMIEYMMMGLIAMTIVATLRMVGIVMALSLLTVPQMTANIFTYSFKKMIAASIVIGFIDCVSGLALSYWLNVPSGATIIFVSIVIYVMTRTIKTTIGKFNKSEVAQS